MFVVQHLHNVTPPAVAGDNSMNPLVVVSEKFPPTFFCAMPKFGENMEDDIKATGNLKCVTSGGYLLDGYPVTLPETNKSTNKST